MTVNLAVIIHAVGKKMSGERIYVIGDRGAGVLLVKTEPLRVVEISDAEISKYSQSSGGDGYAKVAAALWRLASDYGDGAANNGDAGKTVDVEKLVASGGKFLDVDFAFSAKFGAGPVLAHAQSEPPPPVKAHAQSEPPPPVKAHAQSEPPPPVKAHAQSEPPPPVKAHAQSEPPPPVKAHAQSEPPPPVKAHAQSEPPLHAQAHAQSYPPLGAALLKLFGDEGEGLQSAVLSDET